MTRPIPEEALQAWNSGRKVQAIKLLREACHLSLAEAKRRVDAAEQGQALDLRSEVSRGSALGWMALAAAAAVAYGVWRYFGLP